MNEGMTKFNAMDKVARHAVFKDWVDRGKHGAMRGEGLWSHVLYLDMIAQEQHVTISEIARLGREEGRYLQ